MGQYEEWNMKEYTFYLYWHDLWNLFWRFCRGKEWTLRVVFSEAESLTCPVGDIINDIRFNVMPARSKE